MQDLLKIHRESFNEIADRLFSDLKTKGYKPKRARYEDIISTLKILYGSHFDDYENLKFSVTDGDDDGGIDAVVFTKTSLDIFEFKITSKLSQKELINFVNRFERAFINKPSPLTVPTNARLNEVLGKWWKKKKPEINIYFVRPAFGKLGDRHQQEIDRLETYGWVKVSFVDDNELLKKLLDENYIESSKLSTDGVVTLDKVLVNRKISELIIKVPIFNILELYSEHLEKEKNLFAQNIRIPSASIQFMKSMEENISEHADTFHLLHNGLVLVVKLVTETGNSYILSKPQVVNGAQTLGSLYKSYKADLTNQNLKKAHVICKVFVTKNEEDIQRVCEATNTQKAVKTEDLRTNDVFQKQLEVYIKSASFDKFFYNRKGTKKPNGSIVIHYVKFYQWCYAAFAEKPAEAKNARKKLFIADSRGMYNEINQSIENNINKIINLCETAHVVEGYIKGQSDKSKKSLLQSMNLHIIAALFHKSSVRKSDFNKCFSILNKFYNAEKIRDENITPNKVFTKKEEAWVDLKNKFL